MSGRDSQVDFLFFDGFMAVEFGFEVFQNVFMGGEGLAVVEQDVFEHDLSPHGVEGWEFEAG